MLTLRWLTAVSLLIAGFEVGCTTASAPLVPPSAPVRTPAEATAVFAPEAKIPLDPGVTIGRLANGLTYYVRANAKPENRASLRLVVNAGSLVEDDDQRGLAHFVEHMAFNGTENFAKQELVDYLETIGMRFGADVNAYTNFEETVYMLEVPTDDQEIFANGFQILEDWARGVSFDGEEIDKERGVVIEEWRLRRGARGRINDRQLPVLFHGSRYAERQVIGDKETLESAAHDTLRRFYRDWYRPELMAVVAVGAFDEAEVIRLIEDHFGGLTGPAEPRPRVAFEIPGHEPTLTSIVTDPEATSIGLAVVYKRPAERVSTVGELRQQLIDELYDGMMNSRLRELSLLSDPPYQGAFAGSSALGRSGSSYQLAARVRDGGVERALTTLLTEAKRVVAHGFVASELERAKSNTLRSIERAYEERDKRESVRFAGGYVQHYLEHDALPGIAYLRDLFAAMVPAITLSEVNARSTARISEQNRVILVSGPEKEAAAIPDEQQLLAVFEAVDELAVTPWVDRTRDEPLVAVPPTAGRVVAEHETAELGVTRWTLANGVEVLLKPTDFKNDEVLLSAYSPGGHSLVADEDYVSAVQAAGIVGEMGLGGFDQVELGKKLTGKVVGVAPYIGEISEGLSGGASPQDLETLFQLIYLHFGEPRRDEQAFESYLSTTRGLLENQQAAPSFWFSKAWSRATFGDHPRRQLLTLETMEQVALDSALAAYGSRFADASDFIFTLVGNFELEAIRPLVESWLGGLPATDRDESWRDVEAYAKPTVSRFEVVKGIEPKSSVRLVFHGFTEWSPGAAHLASSLGEVLRIQLRDVLREDLGGVYGVNVYSSISRFPRARYNSGLAFGCDPERTDELLAAALAEIEKLKNEGPTVETVEKVKEIQRRSREKALERNEFWLSALQTQAVNDLPLVDILDFEARLERITVDSIREAAQRYFDSERYVQGILRPELSPPSS